MTQQSMWWSTNGVGHGPLSGYSRDRWQDMLRKLFQSDDVSSGAVLVGVDNQLAVTTPGDDQVTIASGAAIVYGHFYENTAPETINLTSVFVGTTGGRVVLRADWSNQVVYLAVVQNTDGLSAIPAATQTPGTTYENTLATYQLATDGTVTLTDARTFTRFSGRVEGGNLDPAIVDNTTLQLVSNVLGVKALGIDETKIGDGILAWLQRIGGNATDPMIYGTTTYPISERILVTMGSVRSVEFNGADDDTFATITFPTAYAKNPFVFAVLFFDADYTSNWVWADILVQNTTTTGTSLGFRTIDGSVPTNSPSLQYCYAHWIAIGERA